jgi:type IV pilus assembly protein PilN
MIRINLIAPEKPSQKKKAPSAPGAFQFYLFLILFGGGALGLCVAWYLYEAAQISRLDKETVTAQKRQRELQVIKDQVDALEAKRKTFQTKVDLIERLRREQSGPVHLLDEMSKALPDLVWLKTVEQTGGSLKIVGQSNSLTAVADFMSALQRSGWFPTVEMGQTKADAMQGGASDLIEFNLTATFKDPEIAAKEKAAAQAAPAPGPSPAKGPAPRKS